jgi:hypothetical protein
MAQPGAAVESKAFSPRRRLRRRVLIFSGICGFATLLAGAVVFWVTNVYAPLRRLAEDNAETLRRVRCDVTTCDMSDINADPEFVDASYVLDTSNYYLLGTPTVEIPGFPLRYADFSFVRRFEAPASFAAPDGELWRLYSAVKQVGGRSVGVIVGYAEKASWKMDLPTDADAIDTALHKQLDLILGGLREANGRIEYPRRRIAADGYLALDTATGEVFDNGLSLPMYFPRTRPLPGPGASLYRHGRRLYAVRADSDGRILVDNVSEIGDLFSVLRLAVMVLTGGFALGYSVGMTFLRRFLLLKDGSTHTLAEALRLGEGLTIEFKRSISFEVPNSVDRVLETVAALANTADGTIFIGVEDNGRINGLKLEGGKARDALTERIHQVVRHRIRPVPLIRVDYLEAESKIVCRIFVPRGEQPLYVIDGVIYVREGPADIKAPPERVLKLVEEFAM